MTNKMKVYSIFHSFDGEVNLFGQGAQSIFIRFAGCNLKCRGCDTEYALDPAKGQEMSVWQIMEKLDNFDGTLSGSQHERSYAMGSSRIDINALAYKELHNR